MKMLTNQQMKEVSGGSEGIYYYDGVSYEFNCPNVSQMCLDTYLSFIEKTPPGLNSQPATLNAVLVNCSGAGGILAISPCLDDVVAQVRRNHGLA